MKKNIIYFGLSLIFIMVFFTHPAARADNIRITSVYSGVPQTGFDGDIPEGIDPDAVIYKGMNETQYESSFAPTDAGEYAVIFDGEIISEITIEKAPLVISAVSKRIYEGSPVPKLTYTVNGLIGSDVLIKEPNIECAYDGGRRGKYEITVSGADAGDNYCIEYKNAYLTVASFPVLHYMLGFETNGGSRIDNITYPYGNTVKLDKYRTERPGYEFTGWYTDRELTVRIDEFTFDHNAVIYAGWQEISGPHEEDDLCPIERFTDLDVDAWYHDAVHYCIENGIIKGIEPDVFAPDMPVTRAMLVTMLWRLENSPETDCKVDFQDVKSGSYYEKAVRWASEAGIVFGINGRTFAPDREATREQMTAVLYRYAAYISADIDADGDLSAFSDHSEISVWAENDMRWAVGRSLLVGDSGRLMPKEKMRRSECAQIIYKFIKIYSKIN